MDKLSTYRSIIQRVLGQRAEQTPSIGHVETVPLFDQQSDQYAVIDFGWDPTGRVHAVVIHLRLHNGKVWIEADSTEQGIAQDLLDAGIPQ